jgi:nitronate monooxygenase
LARRGTDVLKTRFTELVGCNLPIQLAGMPGVCTVELVAAVSESGGLGMTAAPLTPPRVLAAELDRLRALTKRPFGVNFLIPFLDLECLDVAAGRARVIEFFFGAPDPSLVVRARAHGALVGWQVGSVEEARAAEQAGCDLIVAQGIEAGGHVRGAIGLLPLLAEILDAVSAPVVAAGGIATARAMAGALATGAAAVRMGTRFVATRESGAHPVYVQALLGARAEDTVHTESFSVMWPDAPHRVLASCIEAARALPDGPVGEIDLGGGPMPVPRFAVPAPTRGATGRVDAMALYAGQSVGAVGDVPPAGDLLRRLAGEAEALLRPRG